MKQGQYSPMGVAQMAISLFAANEGFLDDVPVSKVRDFEDGLQGYMKSDHAKLLDEINAKGDYSDAIQKSLKDAIAKYKATHTW
jgi:F-type H+-transporting ATPase subunit alpha